MYWGAGPSILFCRPLGGATGQEERGIYNKEREASQKMKINRRKKGKPGKKGPAVSFIFLFFSEKPFTKNSTWNFC
jgi:hypothetical protein